MVVRDLRMFRRGQEAFCRGLAIAAARQEGVRSVQIGLESSTCRIEFAPGRLDAGRMAERFARAVREAVAGTSAERREDGRPARWGALAAFPDGQEVEGASLWEIVREGPGRLGARHARLRDDPGLARRVAREMRVVPGVLACRLSPVRRDLRITYDPARLTEFAVVDRPEEILRQLLRRDPGAPADEGSPEPAVASGLRRVYYLGMAGGSFTLTLVGLVVPGIPTVPFLLATSYYLARSSRRLNRRLAHSRFFGPILTDLEKYSGLRPINKLKLVGLVLAVGSITIVLAGPAVILVLIMAGAASVSLYAIMSIPSLPSGGEGERSPSPAFA
jgi:uncharacterized membrane protein YbaN (DUF454 family)